MGTDGHIASLFPAGDELSADAFVTASCNAAHRHERISLTFRALLEGTGHIFLLVGGDEKLQTYRRAMNGQDFGELPVRRVLHQNRVPVTVFLHE